MEIKNTTPVSENMFIKLRHFEMRVFKKYNFLNYLLWGTIAFLTFLHALVSVILFYISENDVGFPYYSLMLLVLITGFHYICYYVLPQQMYKASPLYRGKEVYVFGKDSFSCRTENAKLSSGAVYKYGDIRKVYERTSVFYVYLSSHHAIMVSKEGFEAQEELEALRRTLKASVPANKYKVIK